MIGIATSSSDFNPCHRQQPELVQSVARGIIAAGGLPAGRTPDQVVTAASVRNALRVLLAIGGSTNALIHLTAMAGRLGITIDPDVLNELSETTPVLVELKPTGQHYMADLHASGGLPAVLHELRELLDLSVLTVTGETLGERLGDGPAWVDREVVRPFSEPSREKGGLVWLRGSLAPSGALIKRSAADAALFETTGRAVVFSSLEDLAARVDDPGLDVEPTDVLVLQNAGPVGAGMPEAGYLPIPASSRGPEYGTWSGYRMRG